MANDVLINKASIIERCLVRIEQEYLGHEAELATNFTRQDSIVLNLQRACEASIDAAMHLVRVKRLGVPQESREAFTLLHDAGIINEALKSRLQAMVGFRNVAVHDYRKLNLDVVRKIVEDHLGDFRTFCEVILKSSFD
jgi:uncharacterized protein YutE (UPF0331/DUF86 family)